jgi:alkylation response protein AidB-like acyl-CoA dehydrogenase
MDFGLSEEQRLLEDSIGRFLDEEVPIARARELAEAQTADGVVALWSKLAELGIAGVLVPTEYDGSGLTLLDACVIAETLGRHATPAPFLANGCLAPVALLSAGSPGQKADALGKLASGALRIGVAATEWYARRADFRVDIRDGALVGKGLFALDVPGADAILVAAGPSDLALVPVGAPGLVIEPLTTIDPSRRVAELVFESVRPVEWIGGRGGGAIAIERMLDAGRAVLAADTLGACDEMLRQAVAYSADRKQFGRAIGSFQAVQHRLADCAIQIEASRWLAREAAFHGAPEEATATAAVYALAAAGDVFSETHQLSGAIGFTREHDLHVFSMRLQALRIELGGLGGHRRALAAARWGAGARKGAAAPKGEA